MAREPDDITIVWDDVAIAAIPRTPGMAALLDRVSGAAVQTMKFLCPVSPVGPLHRSGTLRTSIHAFRQPDASVIIGPTADYAQYVEHDTVPHVIESHGPWPLRNRETGQVFGRVVHHPGTTGQHFVQRTAESFQGREYRA